MRQFNITGMSCAACSARVENAVSSLDGVSSCSVNLLTNSMVVEGNISDDEIISAVIKNFLKYKGVAAFLSGVRPCVVALILGTSIELFMSNLLRFDSISQGLPSPDLVGLIIFALVAIASFGYKKLKGKKPSPIILIVLSAVLGMLLYSLEKQLV